MTMLPSRARQALLAHLQKTCQLHQEDVRKGLGRAPLPDALLRKYPNADRQWGWQYVFPASRHYTDRVTGLRHRHHVHESVIRGAVHEAIRRAGIPKPASCHTFPPLLRNPLAGRRLRHPTRSGTSGAQRPQDNHDLHPRPQQGRLRSPKPGGRPLTCCAV